MSVTSWNSIRDFDPLRSVLQMIPDYIWLKDKAGVYLACNHAVTRLLGAKEKDIVGKTDYDFLDKQVADAFHQKDEEAIAAKHILITEEWVTLQENNQLILLETRKVQVYDSNGEIVGILNIGRDITKSKHIEIERQRLIDIIEESVDFIGSADMHSNLLYHNHAAKRMVGLPDYCDMLDMTISNMHPEWALKLLHETALPTVFSKGVWRGESAVLHQHGYEIPVFQTIVLHRDEQGKPEFMSTIMQDITARKQKDERLALLDYAFNHINEAIFLIDENARFVQVNEKACSSLGYTREELLTLRVFDIDPDFTPEHWDSFKSAITDGTLSVIIETRHKTKDGRIFPVEVSANHIFYGSDGEHYDMAMVRDISERKEKDKQLLLLNYALDHVGEAAWLIDENAQFHYNNAQACRALGYSREELLTLGVPNIDPDYQLDIWPEHWQDLKTNGSLIFESRHRRRDGHIFPVEINANYFEFDGKGYNLALIRDITERKKTQEALQRSESSLAEAQRITHIGSWEVNFASGELLWSDETYRIWEIDKSQFGATIEAFYETLHPEDKDKVTNAYTESVANKTFYYIEHRLLFSDGRVKYIAERGEPLCDENGDVIRFVGTAMDITEPQRVKETLEFVAQRGWQNSNESFLVALTQYLAQIFGVDYVIIDKVGTQPTQAETVAIYVKGNIFPNMQYDLEGTPCNDVMNGKLCTHPKDVQQLFPDDILLVEMQVESYAAIPLWNTNGDVIGLIAVMDTKPMQDVEFITSILQLVATSIAAELERQRAEQVLLDSHHFLKQIVNTLADPVFVKDRAHRWVLLNQAFCEFIGHPIEQLHGKSDYDFFPAYQADVFWAKDELVFTNCGENINEEEFTDAKGVLRTIITKKTCYTDSNGQQFLVGIITDITERKHMEDELAAREQQFRVLAESLPSPVFRFDKECRRIYMNPIAEKIIGKTAEELLYQKASDSSPINQDELKKAEKTIEYVLKTGEPKEEEVLFRVPATGEIYYFHNSYAPEFDVNGNVTGVISISHDITERKHMEEIVRQREQEFRILVETSPSPIIRYDANCRRVYVNPAVEKMAGKTSEELLAHLPTEGTLLSEPIRNETERMLRHVLETGQMTENEVELVLADGQTHYFYNRYAPELDANGKAAGVVLVAHDITARKQAENLLLQREQEFRTLVDNLPTVVIRYNRNLERIYANRTYHQATGITEAEFADLSITERWVCTNMSAEEYLAILANAVQTQENSEIILECPDAQGKLCYFETKIVPEYDVDGQVQSILVLGFDSTERHRQQVVENNRQLVFEKMAHGDDLDAILGQVALYVESSKSGRYCAILLFDEMEKNLELVAAPSFPESYCAKSGSSVLEIKQEHCTGWLTSALLKQRVVIENVNEHSCYSFCQSFIREIDAKASWAEPILSASNQLLGVVTIYLNQVGAPDEQDSALLLQAGHLSAIAIERKRIEHQMSYQASYDTLTGLPNRRMFNNRLRTEILRTDRSGHKLALLFIDLDHFKEVNDTLGHETGDKLLIDAANRIQHCIRESDTVARLGGDEFVVILPDVGDIPPLERIAEAIIETMVKPFRFGEYVAYISASVGIAVYPQDADNTVTLMSCADQAMYSAKEQGRNSFSFFTHSMQEQAHQRLYLINSLRRALDNGQLEMYFQPIVDVVSGKAVKAEALLRWSHPNLGMVSPEVFIPLAEETNLIQEIGSWVFYRAADMAKRWNLLTNDNAPRKVSINMSPRQLTKGNGEQIAIDYLNAIELDSRCVVIEITEGLLLDNSPDIIEKLAQLRTAGIEISLDDFGTGYSAISYLKKFNLDYLKIDRSFVQDLEIDADDRAITEAIVVMAHRLGLKVIAEGVETEGQRALLAAVGCEYIQGYFYSKPLPAEAFLSYVLQ